MKEEIGDLEKIASPYLSSVIMEKGRPLLPSRTRDANVSHVFLDRAFAHANTQLEQLSTNTSAPQSRFSAAISLINATVSSGIFGLEDAARDLYLQNRRASMTIPPKERLLLDNEQRLLPCTRRSSEKD